MWLRVCKGRPPDDQEVVHVEQAVGPRCSCGGKWGLPTARGTISGRSTVWLSPSWTMTVPPAASTFLSQSAVVPYGSVMTNPSSFGTATTGVS